MISTKIIITHLAGFACFNVACEGSASALCNLDHYCITLTRTLKHLDPAKCVITSVQYMYILYENSYT